MLIKYDLNQDLILMIGSTRRNYFVKHICDSFLLMTDDISEDRRYLEDAWFSNIYKFNSVTGLYKILRNNADDDISYLRGLVENYKTITSNRFLDINCFLGDNRVSIVYIYPEYVK